MKISKGRIIALLWFFSFRCEQDNEWNIGYININSPPSKGIQREECPQAVTEVCVALGYRVVP